MMLLKEAMEMRVYNLPYLTYKTFCCPMFKFAIKKTRKSTNTCQPVSLEKIEMSTLFFSGYSILLPNHGVDPIRSKLNGEEVLTINASRNTFNYSNTS